MKLWYNKPAAVWTDALPLGNGRIGAMVFGGTTTERFALNEDTLWSGTANRSGNNPGALDALPEVRRAALDSRYADAHEESKRMHGEYGEAYMPLGDLLLDFGDGEVSDYHRELDLDTATATTRYKIGGVTFTREAFVSAPDNALVVRITADVPRSISSTARLHSQLQHVVSGTGANALRMTGDAPTHSAPEYVKDDNPIIYGDGGITFAGLLHADTEGGTVATTGDTLTVAGADAVTLLFSAATSFISLQEPSGCDPVAAAQSYLDAAKRYPYAELRARHIADHQSLFRRVTLNLGAVTSEAEIPTDERIRRFPASQDPALAALLFDYGRYLLITSSRAGTQPANLQGIWNAELRPPWSSNHTLNINAEMNYWLAETANLSECDEPFLHFITELARNGTETARINYGANGWTAHHNSDIWCKTSPVEGDPCWANWPLAGAWLCSHLWEHYQFTLDADFLREAFPTMVGAARFCLDWLVEDANGYLVTAPSTAPENKFIAPDGSVCAVAVATTMDISLIRDLFTNVTAATAILGTDVQFAETLDSARMRLLPPQIGSEGQLMEWHRDFVEKEPQHRHLSHLWGIHPGNEWTPDTTPEWCDAARRSLELRGGGGTGWSLAWKINLWARLRDGNHAYLMVQNLLNLVETNTTSFAGGVYANLFDAHPPFQIDGNFGYVSGVVEMLLQSHDGVIDLLPALPDAWATGRVSGLKARGGFRVGISWANGELTGAIVESEHGTPCTVRYHAKTVTPPLAKEQTAVFDANLEARIIS